MNKPKKETVKKILIGAGIGCAAGVCGFIFGKRDTYIGIAKEWKELHDKGILKFFDFDGKELSMVEFDTFLRKMS